MGWFDDILNFIIPPVIIIAMAWWLWTLFKPMFGGLGDKVKSWFNPEPTQQNQIKNITYE
jgi:hypothetical protein